MSVLDRKINRRRFLRPALSALGNSASGKAAEARPVLSFEPAACWARQGINPDCDYCFDRCPLKGTAVILDGQNGPVFDAEVCDGCGKCVYYCPAEPKPLALRRD